MNIGSVSKTITATAVLKLYETGKIDLNSNINDYLDFIVSTQITPTKPITVKQLLTHTSSIKME